MDYKAINDQVDREFHCDCSVSQVTKKTAKNGVVTYWRQCMRCGNQLGSVPKGSPLIINATEIDKQKPKDWWGRKSARQQQLIEAAKQREDDVWWRRYEAYLSTPKWAKKRQDVLSRDSHLCQACRTARASEVHHLTYKHVFDEPLFDLVSVCKPCHDRITEIDEKRRRD